MKFTARKAKHCTWAGIACHEFETNNVKKMAEYIMTAYSNGLNNLDRRDNDSAYLCDSRAGYEMDNWGDITEEEKTQHLANYNGSIAYDSLPTDSLLLYVSHNGFWRLVPIRLDRNIIDELLSMGWADLEIDWKD
jgi:hypothetical protein